MRLRIIICLVVLFSQVIAEEKLRSRPAPEKRMFSSFAIDNMIEKIKSVSKSDQLAKLFENSFPNTLDTTVKNFTVSEKGLPDTYVITGDIDAMWLRDSSNQVLTYQDFYQEDPQLALMVKGVIRRQINYVLLDPYANAFNYANEGGYWMSDTTTRNFFGIKVKAMIPQLHERKFEIDSLANVLNLQNTYFSKVEDKSIFDFKYFRALKNIIRTLKLMQEDHSTQTNHTPYTFSRNTNEPTDTQSHAQGHPTRRNGLIRTFFRPSDDATLFQYNIPGNAFVSATLNATSQILNRRRVPYPILLLCQSYRNQTRQFSHEIKKAIYKHGLSHNKQYFMFEVDGFGNGVFMDDANMPSLLGLPLFGFVEKNDTLYQNTRQRLLSSKNPYYFSGRNASGIGGPHVGLNYIWPMSIIVQGLTSLNETEIKYCLETLVQTTAGTNFIHESFHKDNPTDFTRKWFAWANGLFGELVLDVYKRFPHLITK